MQIYGNVVKDSSAERETSKNKIFKFYLLKLNFFRAYLNDYIYSRLDYRDNLDQLFPLLCLYDVLVPVLNGERSEHNNLLEVVSANLSISIHFIQLAPSYHKRYISLNQRLSVILSQAFVRSLSVSQSEVQSYFEMVMTYSQK